MGKQGTNVGNVRLGRLSLSEQKQNENLYLLNTFISCSSVLVSSWKDDKTKFSSVESSIVLRVFVVPQWYHWLVTFVSMVPLVLPFLPFAPISIFNSVLRPFQDYFSSYETGQ